MSDPAGALLDHFNGEIYNYWNCRAELTTDYSFRTKYDTEVLLGAYLKWSESCLDRLVGMFAFLIWDDREPKASSAPATGLAVKRSINHTSWGVSGSPAKSKPSTPVGIPKAPNPVTWALTCPAACTTMAMKLLDGIRDSSRACFTWSPERGLSVRTWYDVAKAALEKGLDTRQSRGCDELSGCSKNHTPALPLRRAVGVCLSGGLDSSLLPRFGSSRPREDPPSRRSLSIAATRLTMKPPLGRTNARENQHPAALPG